MYQNYPNPFNPVTAIPFSVPEREQVRIKIYDITGREVASLANGMYDTRYYSLQFNGAQAASGIYLVRAEMTAENNRLNHRVITRKMALLK